MTTLSPNQRASLAVNGEAKRNRPETDPETAQDGGGNAPAPEPACATASSTGHQRLTREETQALTRERLIEAATRLFAAQGYGATSLRDIAEQAGYSQGAFYSNFDSKEALLLEMLRRHMAAEAEQLALLTTGHSVSRAVHGGARNVQRNADEVLDGLEAWAATLDQNVNWSMLSIELQLHAQRSTAFATAYQAVWQKHREALAYWIGRLFADRGLCPPIDVEDIAASMMALAHGLSLQRAAANSGVSSSMLVAFLRGLIAMALPLENEAPRAAG